MVLFATVEMAELRIVVVVIHGPMMVIAAVVGPIPLAMFGLMNNIGSSVVT